MIVKKYKAKLETVEQPITGVYTLTFSPERGRFRYEPGQFLHLAIDNDYDGVGQWPVSRCFSMQSSPEREYIQITYAVKGAFTHQMEQSMKQGAEVWLKLPYGELFSLAHNREHTVFIAGGTGITPFLSLFTDTSFATYIHPVLYAGFKCGDFDIYEKELRDALAINASMKIQKIYEDTEGILNIDQIYDDNGADASYFISGPPAMIKAFRLSLLDKGVPHANILTDDWE